MQTNNRSNWIGYLKDGAETILKEAKSASEKVVDAVVHVSAQYSAEGIQNEAQPAVVPVTSRIIAFSIPNSSPHSLETVVEMSCRRYGMSAFLLNLLEITLPPDLFAIAGHVMNCDWGTSTPPSITSLCHVLEAVDTWLSRDPSHVVLVLSDDGSGNCALFVASYLIACGLYESATAALQYYARCWFLSAPSSSGILNASQRRYLEYVEHLTRSSSENRTLPRKVILVDLLLSSSPLFSVSRSNCKPFLEVFENGKKILSTLRDPSLMRTYSSDDGVVTLPVNVCVTGDVRVAVYHARNFIGGKMSAMKMFQVCFNTAFVNPDCVEMKLPKLRLDGIGRNESKFDPRFNVSFSISVQLENQSEDCGNFLNITTEGSFPPICCTSEDEFHRIHQITPDRGKKKSSLPSNESASSAPISRKFEKEQAVVSNERIPTIDKKLINLSGNSPERLLAMSDPVTRKASNYPKKEEEVLLDLLSPTPMSQSVSTPNLAENQASSSFGIPNSSSDSMISSGNDILDIFCNVPETTCSPSFQRNTSVNLLDFSSAHKDSTLDTRNFIGTIPTVEVKPPITEPPTILIDPFVDGEIENKPFPLYEPLLIPTPVASTPAHDNNSTTTPSSIPTPLHPKKAAGSMANTPTTSTNGSRNASPHASPSIPRRNHHDPFSDLLFDTKTAQMNRGTSNCSPKVAPVTAHTTKPSAASHHPGITKHNATLPTKTSQNSHSTQLDAPNSIPKPGPCYSSGPNYFSSASSSAGRVFAGESSKPWQHPAPDTFADLLPGEEFTKTCSSTKQQTLLEQRREELERTTDPVKLKILDWTRGKEGNIRALLSSLGDVLWDGETRWSQPGMHLMITPVGVKKMYRNASRVVHPDKQMGTPHEELAKSIQTELNDAYTTFEEAEGM